MINDLIYKKNAKFFRDFLFAWSQADGELRGRREKTNQGNEFVVEYPCFHTQFMTLLSALSRYFAIY